MLAELLATVFPVGVLLLAAGYAFRLTTCPSVDPKTTLLDGLLQSAAGEGPKHHHSHAAD